MGRVWPRLDLFLWAIADHTTPYHVIMPDGDLWAQPEQSIGPVSAAQAAAAEARFLPLRFCAEDLMLSIASVIDCRV